MPKTMGEIFGLAPEHRSFKESKELVCNNTCVGVEIEMENVQTNLTHVLWDNVDDGSLRNAGREFIFNGPLRGNDVVRAINAFHRYTVRNPDIDASERCSIHVHVDMRDMSEVQLHAVLSMYIAMERVLFRYVGTDRADNNYCLPYFKAATIENELHKFLGDHRSVQQAVHSGAKYWACNIRSIAQRGTLEFRQHGGTKDAQAILRWINILLSIKKAGLRMAKMPLAQYMSKLGPARFLQEVFGDLAEHLLTPQTPEDLFQGLRFLDHISYYGIENDIEGIMAYRERGKEDDLLRKYAKSTGSKYLTAPPPIVRKKATLDGGIAAEEEWVQEILNAPTQARRGGPIPPPVFTNNTTGITRGR